ncbi:MAG TPA: SpoIIE family protein phosphatase [Jatrophihabitans sp.]|uniref:SpoIIE family protein phosphatase n=1 Tax=Jatrophihabitans sp. TaxID=1932789 RepID=UPI002E0ABD9C|nr:SpoIIE family protein phosphatase [Jatrophihabitans sp.]
MDTSVRVGDLLRLSAVEATGLLDTPAEEPFDRLARLASLLLDAPYAFVTVVDATRSYWKSCVGIDATDPADRQNPVEESFCQYVIATEEPLIIGDAAADPRTAGNPSIESMGVAAWAGYPLRSTSGQVLGTFCVVDTEVRQWTERDAAVLETLAAAASGEVALRTAVATATTATAAARAGQERLTFLGAVSDLLAGKSNAEEAVGALAHQVVPYLADWAVVTVLDDVTHERRDLGRGHRDPTMLAALDDYIALHQPAENSPIPTAIRTGEPVIIETVDDALIRRSLPHPEARAALAELDPGSVAVFPLRGRDHPFGAIALYNAAPRGRHTAEELRVGQEMARRAGALLENVRLHDQQRRLAETLQRSLLSSPPALGGLDVAVRYLPAAGNRVGGDWYDVYEEPDGSTVLVIGDVVGHDLQAIAVMGQLRTMTRTIGYDRMASPAELLGRVDDAIRGLAVRSLCTAVVVRLRAADRTDEGIPFTWSCAGHPPPLLVRDDGTAVALDAAPELLLGVRPDTRRTDHNAVLPPGATLLLTTDGLFERRHLAFEDALDRLRRTLAGLAEHPIEDLCDKLIADIGVRAGEDDIALIAVRPV